MTLNIKNYIIYFHEAAMNPKMFHYCHSADATLAQRRECNSHCDLPELRTAK